MFYFTYLTPKISSLATLWKQAELVNKMGIAGINDIQQDAATRMGKSIEALKHEFSKIRTGRAHPSLLDQINVSYYGTDSALSQVANIAVEDARTLTITPWEKGMVQAIEKAILKSDLGLNPATNGMTIRIPVP